MCLPPANARICPNPLLYSAVYHRYSLKSFQLCKSAQTYWYRKYFEHIVARFQGDSSCLTIDNIKPELCRNSAPLYNPMSVVDNSAPLFFHSSHFNCNDNKSNPLSRVLKENINKIYKMQHFSTLGDAAYKFFKTHNLCGNEIGAELAFPRVVKCCILYILFIFSFNTLDKGLKLLLLQLKWLEWKNNGRNCQQQTSDYTMAPNFDKVQVLCCRWLNS